MKRSHRTLTRLTGWVLAAGISLAAAGLLACSEAGPTEKAGKKVDEMVEKIQHGDEGALEKAGRKIDEAFEDASKEVEKAADDLKD